MIAMMLAGFLTVFGWSLLMVMVFLQAVLGGAYTSERQVETVATS